MAQRSDFHDRKNQFDCKADGFDAGGAREIIKIMREYDVQTAQVYDRSNLPRRVEAFLAAKRIDGCRPRTLEGYRERLKVLIGRCKKPVQKITTDDLREHICRYLVDERHLKDNSVQAHINLPAELLPMADG
ncbi:MAG: phage integrase N-terminal SAM-like domain-containing protein [Butyricicoccaceae bacterium]